ncbi:hypothetical protein EA472_22560 [Natrarchaeobius oligotrophus]|uniref:Uncharacterized protein n=2 Tax=Natrarchaeobius TaxID=2501796 RepID=A0A3N6MDS3_NATCH|nr:hypothetical protein EA472_22560 [Natrarchaeobius chitinivorans]
MALAEDLSRSKHIGDRQAKVYAAIEVGIARDEICERLDMSESNSYQTYYDAEDNVAHAEHIATMLEDHPALNPPKTVSDVSMSEFDPARDRFDSDTRHGPDKDLTGEQYADGSDQLVTVRQSLVEDSDGIAGYLINRVNLSTGELDRRALSAARLDELIEEGALSEATASLND